MRDYIVKRILGAIPLLLIITVLVFFLLNLSPGNTATALAGVESGGGNVKLIEAQMGLDKPVYVRYLDWLSGVLHGDFGYSYVEREAVAPVLFEHMAATAELMSVAFVVSGILGITFGIMSALRQYSVLDYSLTALGMIWISLPEFFAGLLGAFVFGAKLHLLPIGGMGLPGSTMLDRLRYLVLPGATLGLAFTAALLRYSRATMLDVMRQPYVDTAISKGLSYFRVYLLHAFRNALIPVAVVLVFRLGFMIGGAVLVETVFSWPGMGSLLVFSAQNKDYPVVMAIVLVIATFILAASVCVDVVTALIDPRVRRK